MPTSAPQGRGGARHFKKPYVKTELLLKLLKKHEDLLLDLKGMSLCRETQQWTPRHCTDAFPWWKTSWPWSLLKKCIPKLNSTRFNGSVWTNMKAERLNVLLSHVRKLARSGGSSCLAALTGSEAHRDLAKGCLAARGRSCLGKGSPKKAVPEPFGKRQKQVANAQKEKSSS